VNINEYVQVKMFAPFAGPVIQRCWQLRSLMLIVGEQFIWNLGFALPKCERVTIATFICVYSVAAALAVLGDRFHTLRSDS